MGSVEAQKDKLIGYSDALPTCEAEYVALAIATQDSKWLGPRLGEILGRRGKCPVLVGVDNQGAIALAKRDGWNRRTRHINRRYMFVQDALKQEEIDVTCVQTGEQMADGLTKSLKRELLQMYQHALSSHLFHIPSEIETYHVECEYGAQQREVDN